MESGAGRQMQYEVGAPSASIGAFIDYLRRKIRKFLSLKARHIHLQLYVAFVLTSVVA